MVSFSNDADILKYEPALFGELHLPWQVLIEGTDGALNGTSFTASSADFSAAKIAAGGVVYLRDSAGAIDGAYEIVSVDSPTQLTVSVLRADDAGDAVALGQATDVYYRICTYEPQATEAAFALTEYFGIKPGAPASDVDVADILDCEVLRRASVFAVIAGVYAMLAGSSGDESFWKKSNYYRKCFELARSRARVSIDFGDDGIAERTSSGGAIRLTRD